MTRQEVFSHIYGSNLLFTELARETVFAFFKSYCGRLQLLHMLNTLRSCGYIPTSFQRFPSQMFKRKTR